MAVFEETYALVKGVSGKTLGPKCIPALQSAVDLYQGDLLEGWYQDWCLYERERLQHLYLIMLDKLMGWCEASLDCERGLVYGTRILRYDIARERTHRRLMRLHYLSGDRTAALRQYNRCTTALREELGVKPAKRTIALYKQIESDQLHQYPHQSLSMSNASNPALHKILECLRQLSITLAALHQQVEQNIQDVESILKDHH